MYQKSASEVFRRRAGITLLALGALAALWLVAPGLPVLRGPSAHPETIAQGEKLFAHEWSPGDALAGGDGLGPVFNAKSCATCHFQGGIGGAGDNRHNVTTFLVEPTSRDPNVHHGVIHAFSSEPGCQESRTVVAKLFPILPEETRLVGGCQITVPRFDPVRYESIHTPSLFGIGWIDKIATKTVVRHQRQKALGQVAQELELDFTAPSAGKLRRLSDGRIGRFGWKAQFATLEEFVANACASELGLGSVKQDQARPLGCSESESVATDLSRKQFQAMLAFVATLPRPVERPPLDPALRSKTERGKLLLTEIGCAACHTPNLGGVEGLYSDLLLHTVEDDKSAGSRYTPTVPFPEDEPLPSEWRTPPLWDVADSAPYFHDGASPDLRSAILRHAAEAKGVIARFRKLPDADQAALVAFLGTLRAPGAPAEQYLAQAR
jgi:CxxC motif-containing protein (DUF1111 family)